MSNDDKLQLSNMLTMNGDVITLAGVQAKTKSQTNKLVQLDEQLGTDCNSYALNYNFAICIAVREEEGDVQSQHYCTATKVDG